MSDLPNALDMFKLPLDEFMVEVSRAISPRPWEHQTMSDGCGNTSPCKRCGEDAPDGACPAPPPLTESPADLAFRLRDGIADHATLEDACVDVLYAECEEQNIPMSARWYTFATATPYDQIACCLVALKKWRVG